MKRLIAFVLAIIICALPLIACGKEEDPNTIKVAASSTPHAEILEICKTILAEKGYTLEIKVLDDYIIPNTSTDSGDVDANFFQHQPYLDYFNATRGTKLVTVAKVHFEPYGIYAGKCSDLANLPEGTVVDYGFVMANGLAKAVKNSSGLKVLGGGELSVALTVRAAAFSASAKEAIEAAKGTAEVI